MRNYQMTKTDAETINNLLEAIAQLIEEKTSDKEAANIVRQFKYRSIPVK